jgi:hypothetical protein
MHWPARQQLLPAQLLPVQQGSPGPPQTLQVVPWQIVPSPHAGPVVQQAWPGPPQDTQVPPLLEVVEHLVCAAVQTLPQQGCPAAPQPEHAPCAQVPLAVPHIDPSAMQLPP